MTCMFYHFKDDVSSVGNNIDCLIYYKQYRPIHPPHEVTCQFEFISSVLMIIYFGIVR